jgi:hypothetical protein
MMTNSECFRSEIAFLIGMSWLFSEILFQPVLVLGFI